MQDRRWQRINTVGMWVETALARIVAVALLVVTLVLLLRMEWALLPEAAQEEVVCSEELTAAAARSFVHEEMHRPAPAQEDEAWLEDCRALAAEHREREAISGGGGWWVPLAFTDLGDGDQ
jgi:hypothetical protein